MKIVFYIENKQLLQQIINIIAKKIQAFRIDILGIQYPISFSYITLYFFVNKT